MLSCTVITPTIGETTLRRCLESVQRQAHAALRHLVYVDGPEFEAEVRAIVAEVTDHVPVDVMVAPHNTAAGGYFGHRLYASAAFVASADMIAMLDADNWFEDDHVEHCIRVMTEHGTDWSYSLRSLRDDEGDLIAYDDCDSLGYWPRYMYELAGTGWFSQEEDAFVTRYPYLIDTSCYAVSTRLFVENCHLWYGGYGTDAAFACRLMEQGPGAATGRYSVNYRLHAGSRGDLTAFFEHGNYLMLERYGSPPPWRGFEGVPPLARE